MLAPGAISPKAQLSVSPAMEQPVTVGLSDQLTPLPEGSVSVSTTALAVAGLCAALLLTVIVKVMGSPALTEGASAVLTICKSGQLTVVEALSSTRGLLLASAC